MPTNNDPYDYQLVFPPMLPDSLPTLSPSTILLPSFSGLPSYAPILKLTGEEITRSVPDNSTGVYVVLLWISSHNLLVPVYVGSASGSRSRYVKVRLNEHLEYCENTNLNTIDNYKEEYNLIPKWFYKLLKHIDTNSLMFTWFECSEFKRYENETYHVLKDTPYLLNARAVIKDKRSYRQFQSVKASENLERIKRLLDGNM